MPDHIREAVQDLREENKIKCNTLAPSAKPPFLPWTPIFLLTPHSSSIWWPCSPVEASNGCQQEPRGADRVESFLLASSWLFCWVASQQREPRLHLAPNLCGLPASLHTPSHHRQLSRPWPNCLRHQWQGAWCPIHQAWSTHIGHKNTCVCTWTTRIMLIRLMGTLNSCQLKLAEILRMQKITKVTSIYLVKNFAINKVHLITIMMHMMYVQKSSVLGTNPWLATIQPFRIL